MAALKEKVLVPRATTRTTGDAVHTGYARHAARGAWAGAIVLLFGSFVDLGILWLLQFQPTPNAEFIAALNTLEAYTRFAIAIALMYAALYMGRSVSLWKYRAIAAFMLVLGIVAFALGLVLLNDYFALERLAGSQVEAIGALAVSAVKGIMLSGVITFTFVPLGILGLRRPRAG